MKADRLFIVVSVVLVALFLATVSQNIYFSTRPSTGSGLRSKDTNVLFEQGPKGRVENGTPEILIRLENAGLEPREARYYE